MYLLIIYLQRLEIDSQFSPKKKKKGGGGRERGEKKKEITLLKARQTSYTLISINIKPLRKTISSFSSRTEYVDKNTIQR